MFKKLSLFSLLLCVINTFCYDKKSTDDLRNAILDKEISPEVRANLVKKALKDDADPNATFETELSVLIETTNIGYTEIAQMLVEHGAHVNYRSKNNWTPLASAFQFKNVALAQYFVTKGARINEADQEKLEMLAQTNKELLEILKTINKNRE